MESFSLDHTKVKAPYVRLAGRKALAGGVVEKYDLRLAQPNREAARGFTWWWKAPWGRKRSSRPSPRP